MNEPRKIVAVLTVLMLSVIVLAFAMPALAQTQGMPRASPTRIPDNMQGAAQDAMMMPVEQSGKDMMATMTDRSDITIPAVLMKSAGLEGMIKPGQTYTLFVASDNALKAMSPDTMNTMMEKVKDPQMGKEFVDGHLINGMVMPGEMTDGKTLTMMNGMTMKISKADGRTMVDDASIVKAVRTNNGMIYVMDRIPSSIKTMLENMGMLPMSNMPASG